MKLEIVDLRAGNIIKSKLFESIDNSKARKIITL